MAGLLFLFIIALAIFTISKQEEQEKLEKTKESLTDARAARSQLLEDLRRSMDDRGVRVEIDTDKGILLVPEDVLFPSGSATPQEKGERSLRILAEALGEFLPCYCGPRSHSPSLRPRGCDDQRWRPGRIDAVLVEGHTDNQPITNTSQFRDNWELSVMRAIVTYRRLMGYCPELANLTNDEGQSVFSVAGYEATRPRPGYKHEVPTAEEANRRIELRFMLAPPRPEEDQPQRQ